MKGTPLKWFNIRLSCGNLLVGRSRFREEEHILVSAERCPSERGACAEALSRPAPPTGETREPAPHPRNPRNLPQPDSPTEPTVPAQSL